MFRLIISFLGIATSSVIYAHHNPVNFLLAKNLTLSGNIARVEWVNPHVYIYLDVTNDSGQIEQWSIESQSPLVMARFGWNQNTLEIGETVNITANPSRDRSRNSALGRRVTKEDGSSLPIEWDPDKVRESITR